MTGSRYAVLVGCCTYQSDTFACLSHPIAHILAIQDCLRSPDAGPFDDVQLLKDCLHYDASYRINEILAQASAEDLVLLYFSGHAVVDSRGALHLAFVNTNPNALQSTSLCLSTLGQFISKSRCATVVVVLDCCYRGMEDQVRDHGVLVHSIDALAAAAEASGPGRGVFVIASSSHTQSATPKESDATGLLTVALLDGIREGAADANKDGLVTVDEWYTFAARALESSPLKLKPHFASAGAAQSASLLKVPHNAARVDIPSLIDHLRTLVDSGALPLFIYEDAKGCLVASTGSIQSREDDIALGLASALREGRLAVGPFVESWLRLRQMLSKTDRVAPSPGGPKPVSLEDRWGLTRYLRGAAFDGMLPAYLLDPYFRFIDWNPAFDRLIAKPLGLVRGRHAEDFVLGLVNASKVIERSLETFGPGRTPRVDTEPLEFQSTEYGGVFTFQKLACQIPADDGTVLAWLVCLNVITAPAGASVWEDIKAVLTRYTNWSVYAGSYDTLLLHFAKYRALVNRVCSLLDGAQHIADLGAGTGNGCLQLLSHDSARHVWAFEHNDRMLEHLQRKLSPDQLSHVSIVKGDMTVSLREFEAGTFDGVLMINSLYAIDDRQACISEAYRVLKKNGRIALSTPHRDTHVDNLFAAIRDDVLASHCTPELEAAFDFAYRCHQEMLADIRRDTLDDIVRYLEAAGFILDMTPELDYVNAVYVVCGSKL